LWFNHTNWVGYTHCAVRLDKRNGFNQTLYTIKNKQEIKQSKEMSNKHFIPTNFEIPKNLETNRLKIRMLKVSDVVKDYDAVMSSVKHLQNTKPFGPNQKWPIGLTFEQNLIDLGWHQKEFQMSSSFAYTVMSLDETRCLGCLYIEPTTKFDYDAKIYM